MLLCVVRNEKNKNEKNEEKGKIKIKFQLNSLICESHIFKLDPMPLYTLTIPYK